MGEKHQEDKRKFFNFEKREHNQGNYKALRSRSEFRLN